MFNLYMLASFLVPHFDDNVLLYTEDQKEILGKLPSTIIAEIVLAVLKNILQRKFK